VIKILIECKSNSKDNFAPLKVFHKHQNYFMKCEAVPYPRSVKSSFFLYKLFSFLIGDNGKYEIEHPDNK
jgi:hypothetical protein